MDLIGGERPGREWMPWVKVVMYGSQGAGKSALMTRYVRGYFDTAIESTVGAAFNAKQIVIERIKLSLQIWDTAGSERFDSLAPMYIRGAAVVLLCFDEPDLEDIKKRLVKIFDISSAIEVILVATKMDLPGASKDAYRRITEYATEHDHSMFFTSSKTGLGVDELFEQVAKIGLEAARDERKSDPIKLEAVNVDKKSCCWSS